MMKQINYMETKSFTDDTLVESAYSVYISDRHHYLLLSWQPYAWPVPSLINDFVGRLVGLVVQFCIIGPIGPISI